MHDVQVEGSLAVQGADVEEVSVVDDQACSAALCATWLQDEPARLSDVAQTQHILAWLLTHFVDFEAQVLAAEQMPEHDGHSVSQLVPSSVPLLVRVVLVLDCPLLLCLSKILGNQVDFSLEGILLSLVWSLSSRSLHQPLESVLCFSLLLDKLGLTHVVGAVLLDFHSEEALFELVESCLSALRPVWKHPESLVSYAIREDQGPVVVPATTSGCAWSVS